MVKSTLPLQVACDGQNVTLSVSIADLSRLLQLLASSAAPVVKPATSPLADIEELPALPAADFHVTTLNLAKFADKGKALPWVTRSLRPYSPSLSQEEMSEFLVGTPLGTEIQYRLRSGEIYYAHSPYLLGEDDDEQYVAVGTSRVGWHDYYCCVCARTGKLKTLTRTEANNILQERESAFKGGAL